eukprot:354416-Chlamydomonas_euryale.AAC.2
MLAKRLLAPPVKEVADSDNELLVAIAINVCNCGRCEHMRVHKHVLRLHRVPALPGAQGRGRGRLMGGNRKKSGKQTGGR